LASAPEQIETGQPMPANCDCVAPVDAVRVSGAHAEALAEIAPGEGVLPAGGDHDGAAPLAYAGERLTRLQVAALAALEIANVQVRRPRVVVACVRDDPILTACAELVAAHVQRRGANVKRTTGLDAALATDDANAVLILGGTGPGRNDTSARALARAGRLAVHGIALAPGETAGLGFVAHRPVLLLPGRLDATLAVWLTLGWPLLGRLAGLSVSSQTPQMLRLTRKVTSAVGITELALVRRNGSEAEPLASRYWPLSAIAQADGAIVISPESEGASSGSAVQVWPWE
jgi:molybdopterin molybdotransferase